MTLTEARLAFKPFEYPQAEEYWKKTHLSHWVPFEVALTGDITNWNQDLCKAEREILGGVLKGFTQNEIVIGDYWAANVSEWFPKPEVVMMARAFGDFETIHSVGYNYLSESLGIEEFNEFLQDPAARAKFEFLINTKADDRHGMARSLAVFSAFAEGVSLFSSFAILIFPATRNLLKGVAKIVEWSCRDEATHSEAGCWLFRQFLAEHPELNTARLEVEVREAAHVIIQLEHSFIDSVFAEGEFPSKGFGEETLTSGDLKEYIKYRTNIKLQELGYAPDIEYDQNASDRIASWFHLYVSGARQQDFFAGRETSYAKSAVSFDPNVLSFDF